MNADNPHRVDPYRRPPAPPRQPAPPAMTEPINLSPTPPRRVPPAPIAAASARRTRRTVDLSPAQHRALDIWQRDAADRLGLARVTGQEVLTALIDQLLADPALSAQITRTIGTRR